MIRNSKLATLTIAGAALISSQAWAAGFEKSNMWGGEETGRAGIAAATSKGSNALYFNPAGLVTAKRGNSLSVNVSPTSSQFHGPLNNNNDDAISDRSTTFPFGLTYGHSGEDIGYGVGAFVSGGNSVDYPAVDFATASGYKPQVKTNLSLVELSAGAAYKVNDDFRIGVGYRVVMVQADFAFTQRTPLGANHNGVINAKLTDLKDTQYNGFRAGAQYRVNESTDIGLTFRSEINFDAKGTAGGQVSSFLTPAAAANPSLTTSDATVHSTFPIMVALAMAHRLNEDWDFFGQYDWSQYSRVGEIIIDSNTFASTGNQARLKTDWRDQHTVRVAAEYKTPWPIRFGYIYSTAVTNPDYARASFTAPGPGMAVTLGTGKGFALGESSEPNFKIDGALEYAFANGDVSGKANAGTSSQGSDIRNGSYGASAYSAHLAASYWF